MLFVWLVLAAPLTGVCVVIVRCECSKSFSRYIALGASFNLCRLQKINTAFAISINGVSPDLREN
jgi:hypothetical protein